MDIATILRDFAFSKYESSCYIALVTHHPSNGSQLSKLSGIARSRIYDVLRSLVKKQVVFEIEKGQYVPLPFEELKKKLRNQFESNLINLEVQLDSMTIKPEFDYLLTLNGYDEVLAKAKDIINDAGYELYLRLFPNTWQYLKKEIDKAMKRGVGIRFIAMGPMNTDYEIQANHPNFINLEQKIGGESIDIIADKAEALTGIFQNGKPDQSPFIWTKNHWFVIANRDSLRHDFYHYFLDKLYDRLEPLSLQDKTIYEFIKADD